MTKARSSVLPKFLKSETAELTCCPAHSLTKERIRPYFRWLISQSRLVVGDFRLLRVIGQQRL